MAILLSLILGTGCTEKDPAVLNPEIAVVQIDAKSGDIGRGFLVSADGLIVTRWHLIDHAGDIAVTRADGQKLFADFVQGDRDSDLAIVRVHGEKLPFLKLSDDDVTPGMHLRIIGTNGVAHGVFEQWESSGKEIGFTARLVPADTGAPVIDQDGRVVAVVRGPFEDRPMQFNATPIWHVARMMPSLAQKPWMPVKQSD